MSREQGTPKGERIPQTVVELQAIMARDAETMLGMQAEINKLNCRLNRAHQQITKLRKAAAMSGGQEG